MNKWDKKLRKALKTNAEAQGGEILSFPDTGVVVAVVPCAGNDSEFVRVAVAQCDFKDDEFKRKRGELIALERWSEGESIAVRTLGRDTVTIVEQIASVMDDSVMM